MKICVFSDSHGYTANMTAAIEIERPDCVFFLGDGERDIADISGRYPALEIYAVRGNCDLRSTHKSSLVCELGGARIFATHGHLSDVKYDPGLELLTSQALEAGAECALFGHTHRQHLSHNRGIMLLNPGSAGRSYYPGYAVLNINSGHLRAELKAI